MRLSRQIFPLAIIGFAASGCGDNPAAVEMVDELAAPEFVEINQNGVVAILCNNQDEHTLNGSILLRHWPEQNEQVASITITDPSGESAPQKVLDLTQGIDGAEMQFTGKLYNDATPCEDRPLVAIFGGTGVSPLIAFGLVSATTPRVYDPAEDAYYIPTFFGHIETLTSTP